jgi:aminoglycoside phosphotransferase (APT) family kinase protein
MLPDLDMMIAAIHRDAERLGADLARRFPGLQRWEFDRLVPRAGVHDLRLVLTFADGERREVSGHLAADPSPGWIRLGHLHWHLPRPEDDAALPVAAALSPAMVARIAAATGLALARAELVSYVAGRRAVIRYRGNGSTVYGKLHPVDQVLPLLAKLARLRTDPAGPVILPQWPDAALPGMLLFAGASGILLAELPERQWPAGYASSGRALRWLHNRPSPDSGGGNAVRTLVSELAVAAKFGQRLASFWPEGSARIRTWHDVLAARLPAPGPAVHCHGDYHDRQVRIDGEHSWILDLDGLAAGEAAVDLGNFIAHIDYRLAARGDYRSAEPLAESFLAGYGESAVPAPAVTLSWAIALLRNLGLYVLVPDRWQRLAARLEAAIARL